MIPDGSIPRDERGSDVAIVYMWEHANALNV